jgi:hypothetical protein
VLVKDPETCTVTAFERTQACVVAPTSLPESDTSSEPSPNAPELAALMIEHDCGVIVEESFVLKQVDENFFEEA